MISRTPIRWEGKYEVGHQRIDFEHRIFLDLINNYRDKLEQGAGKESLLRILREIVKYAEFHFLSEENIMAEWRYPELEPHAELHRHLLAEVSEKISGLNKLSMDGIEPIMFYSFLVDWFIHHTIEVDKQLADYLRNNTPTS
jgi:hemerythrin